MTKKEIGEWLHMYTDEKITDAFLDANIDDDDRLALYKMSKAELNAFIRGSAPKDYPNLISAIQDCGEEILANKEADKANERQNQLNKTTEAKQKAVKKKFLKSLSKEQKEMWKEMSND